MLSASACSLPPREDGDVRHLGEMPGEKLPITPAPITQTRSIIRRRSRLGRAVTRP